MTGAALRALARRALAEDLGEVGDLSTRADWAPRPWRAVAVAREPLVVSGTGFAAAVAAETGAAWTPAGGVADGDAVAAGTDLGVVTGTAAAVLAAERTLLNGLGRCSGIATLTRRYVDLADAASGGRARIASTRKTTPGARMLEKQATEDGGAIAHRYGLFDAAMVKDTHREAAGSVTAALAGLTARLPFTATIVVEVDDLAQLDEALAAGARSVLLDNMDAPMLGAAVARVRAHTADGGSPVVCEASGGINLDTVAALAATGVDVLSVGALTTQARFADVALEGRPLVDGSAH